MYFNKDDLGTQQNSAYKETLSAHLNKNGVHHLLGSKLDTIALDVSRDTVVEHEMNHSMIMMLMILVIY